MNRVFIIIGLIIILPLTGWTQNNSENTLKVIFDDGEFFFALEEYKDALPEYLKLVKRGYDNNAYINYKIGICYFEIPGELEKAVDPFEKASKNVTEKISEGDFKEDRAPFDVYIYLGNTYRRLGQFDKAIECYTKYLETDIQKISANHDYVKKEIDACKNAITALKSPVPFMKTNLESPINSNSSNYRAVLNSDQTKMIYMNSLAFYEAIYFSEFKNGEWSRPRNITPEVQSDGDQMVNYISKDGKILLLNKEDQFDSDIYISTLEGEEWTKSKKLSKTINSKFWESHACLSPDEKTIYFTSNRKGSLGELDIFISKKDGDDWSEPVNAGKNVNTILNEETPFVSPDGKRLYFSSQGHKNNIGGYDIYYVPINSDGSFGEVVNLPYPVNTSDDDLFYFPISDEIGFISYFGGEGNGKDDIYKIQYGASANYQPIAQTKTEPIETVEENVVAVIEPKVEEVETPAVIEKPVVDDKPVVEPVKEEPVAITPPPTETVKPKPVVDKTSELSQVIIYPVFYSFDKANLPADIDQKLSDLIKLLKTTNASVDLIGYADGSGDSEYNLQLSEVRAKNVKDFLVSQGISADKISFTGKGSTHQLVIEKDSNGAIIWSNAKYNRRVEPVVKNEGPVKIIYKYNVPEEILTPEYSSK